jgi:hypothetical protein
MSAHRVLYDLGEARRLGFDIIANPGTGGTFDQRSIAYGRATVGNGTFKLPNNGLPMFIESTGAATITNVLGTTVAVLNQDEVGLFVPYTPTLWRAFLSPAAAALAIADATDIPVDDLTAYSAAANVNAALEANFVLGQFPNAAFSTSAVTTALTAAAGVLTGARHVYWQNTADGAVALTPRTATQMYTDLDDAAYVGMSYLLTIINRGDNTITLQAATGIAYTGELTVATTTTRTYAVTFTSATAATVVAVDKGTIET